MLTGASLVMLPLAMLVDGPPALPQDPVTYGAVAYFAVIGTALAYLLYYRVLAAAGSGNAMLVTLVVPPVAIVLGWLVLDERMPPSVFAGFGLLVLGLILMTPPRRARVTTP
jgi:drug/metabolite transporter (DMT)-like permease